MKRVILVLFLVGVWQAGKVAAAERLLPGQEYDGVVLDPAVEVAEGTRPASVRVEWGDRSAPVSGRLFGFNFNWLNSQKFIQPSGSASLDTTLVELCRGRPLFTSRMSGTGSQCIQWKTAIGPVAQRREQRLMPWRSSRAVPAFGPMEWVRFTQAVNPDCELVWVFNLLLGTPRDAADMVEFLTCDPGQNPNGGEDWAAKRVALGMTESPAIAVWELGNELDHYGGWKIDTYVDACRRVIAAVRQVRPDARFSAHVAGAPWSREQYATLDDWRHWHRRVLSELGDDLAFLSFHPYYDGIAVARIHRYIRVIREDIREVTGSSRIRLYHSEHARWPPRAPLTAAERRRGRKQGRLQADETANLRGCLSTADFLMRVMGDGDGAGDMASYHCFHGGPWAAVRPAGEGWYATGIYEMFGLFAETVGWQVAETSVSGPATARLARDNPATFLAQGLVRNEHRALLLLNKSPAASRVVEVLGTGDWRVAEKYVFSASSPDALNTADAKPLRLKHETLRTPRPLRRLVIPPHTLTLLRLTPHRKQ